jgi:2-polyprenyl-3-methyl-5-hydroxy-6-metoxy-1,4-benzoquinol methylase
MDYLSNTESLARQASATQASMAHACITLPPNISEILCRDPKLIGFIAARHKLVAKIFRGKTILEVGCQEGFGTLFVAPYVKQITCIDFFPDFIEGFRKHTHPFIRNCDVMLHDITVGPVRRDFDGVFALDVLEHIDPGREELFWKNVAESIHNDGSAVVGMPSLESQQYASEASRIGHVNCKTGDALVSVAERFFKHVIALGMNDEMLHNGYLPMSHYIFVICSQPRLR